MNESPIPRMPGWNTIGLLLPFMAIMGSMFVLIATPRKEGDWFPSQLAICLQLIHVAAFFGMVCATISLVSGSHLNPSGEYPPKVHLVISVVALVANFFLFVCLFPVWWMK